MIKECYELLKEKLKCNEKKSNKTGLAGSLFFRLEKGKGKENYPKKSDSKLLIYHTLKGKYKKVMEK